MEIKVRCKSCDKEIKIKVHLVDKLLRENSELKNQLRLALNKKGVTDMPDFFKETFK